MCARLFAGVRHSNRNRIKLCPRTHDALASSSRVIARMDDKARNCEVTVETEIQNHERLEPFCLFYAFLHNFPQLLNYIVGDSSGKYCLWKLAGTADRE